MGNRNCRWSWKFYWEQVDRIKDLLERQIRERSSNFDVEKYLLICEQLGEEPNPDKMPLEASAFPYEVQVAFFVLELLPDRYEGMSGIYMGKDWSSANFVFETYKIENIETIVYFAKLYERLLVKESAEEAKRERQKRERQSQAKSGRNTFSVTG